MKMYRYVQITRNFPLEHGEIVERWGYVTCIAMVWGCNNVICNNSSVQNFKTKHNERLANIIKMYDKAIVLYFINSYESRCGVVGNVMVHCAQFLL